MKRAKAPPPARRVRKAKTAGASRGAARAEEQDTARRAPVAGAKPWSRARAKTSATAGSTPAQDQWSRSICERVVGDCHPFQRDAVLDEHNFITLLVGRGGGKTTTMRARAICKLVTIRGARMVYVAPTRDMAIELMWIPLKESLEFYGLLDDFTINESKLLLVCKRTKARYKLVGLDDKGEVNKLRGRPFDEVQVDEASVYPASLLEDLIDRAVGPRLGERNGVLLLGGTPGHILAGPFYEFTRPGSTAMDDNDEQVPLHVPHAELAAHPGWDSWVSHAWTLKTVADLPDAEELYPALVNLWLAALRMKRRKRWGDDHPVWKREYLGVWAADATGRVFLYEPHRDGVEWNQWNPFGNQPLEGVLALRTAIAALRAMGMKDLRFVYAGDNGHKDPFAMNVFAFSPTDELRRIYHVFCFEKVGMYARPIADLLLGEGRNTDKPRGLFGETGWPDASIMDSDHATLAELQNTYGVMFKKADREQNYKVGAIELVNGELLDGRLKVIKGSRLEQQMQDLQWAENQFGILKENKAQANHCTDCAVYGRMEIAGLFETGVVSRDTTAPAEVELLEDEPQTIDDVYADPMLTDSSFYDPWGNQ